MTNGCCQGADCAHGAGAAPALAVPPSHAVCAQGCCLRPRHPVTFVVVVCVRGGSRSFASMHCNAVWAAGWSLGCALPHV